MLSFFPLSAKCTDTKRLLISVVIYLAISALTGWAFNFFVVVPLIGGVIAFISQFVDLYCIAGILVCFMVRLKVV